MRLAGCTEFLRTSGRGSIDADPVRCHCARMDQERSALPDEVHGARAVGAVLVGDLKAAEADLASARMSYRVGFLCRLAVVSPGVSLRLASRLVLRRLGDSAR